MKKYLGLAIAAAVAIMLYVRDTPAVWQMIYTLGLIAIVAIPMKEGK